MVVSGSVGCCGGCGRWCGGGWCVATVIGFGGKGGGGGGLVVYAVVGGRIDSGSSCVGATAVRGNRHLQPQTQQ